MSEPLSLLRAPEDLEVSSSSKEFGPLAEVCHSQASLLGLSDMCAQCSTLESAGWHGTQGSAPQVDLPRGEGAALPQVLADFSLAVFGLRIKVSEGTCNFQNHLFLSWLPTLHPLFYF